MITQYHISSEHEQLQHQMQRAKLAFQIKAKKKEEKNAKEEQESEQKRGDRKDKGAGWDHVTEKHKFSQQD